jgi:hypothetical protein
MNSKFWLNQPVNTLSNYDYNYNSNFELKEIMPNETLLNNINNIICPINLTYKVTVSKNLDFQKKTQLLSFINDMYINNESDILKLHYSIDLFNYFVDENCIILEFYFKEHLIGLIIGKKNKVIVSKLKESVELLEVNFLCLDIQVRHFNITPYMIASLTKESINIFNINKAYYTISKNIESKSFCSKNLYHRIINIPKLLEMSFLHSNINVLLYKKLYNTFSYKTNYMKGKRLLFYNYAFNKESIDIDIDDIAEDLYSELNDFYIKKYDIYECISRETIIKLFKNKSFYHFIIQNDYGIPTDYICFFRLDTKSTLPTKNDNLKSSYYKNGYMYLYYTNDIKSLLEKVTEECYKHKIFDVITLNENFLEDNTSDHLKLLKGCANLKYYMYNVLINNMEASVNGLITI